MSRNKGGVSGFAGDEHSPVVDLSYEACGGSKERV